MMCAKKISWVIIILAVSFLSCSNPAGDTTGSVSPRPTWKRLRVKFEVSGVVAMRGGRPNNNMIRYKHNGNWDYGETFNSEIDESWWREGSNNQPAEPFIYDTKEVVVYRGSPQISIEAYSGGDQDYHRDREDYLTTKIYVKKTDTDDYKLYAQKRGDRPDYRNANLEVILTADLTNYR